LNPEKWGENKLEKKVCGRYNSKDIELCYYVWNMIKNVARYNQEDQMKQKMRILENMD
jgi:hypothetical protein